MYFHRQNAIFSVELWAKHSQVPSSAHHFVLDTLSLQEIDPPFSVLQKVYLLSRLTGNKKQRKKKKEHFTNLTFCVSSLEDPVH